MRTFQDLQSVGENEELRKKFIKTAVQEYRASGLYATAMDAEMYYSGENPTISRYEKILYDMQGIAYKDAYTANHKLASSFFGFATDQEVQYLLGNGVSFTDEKTSGKLGEKFDNAIVELATEAIKGGVAYGFWDVNHIQVFTATEFVPLRDEEDGALKAGIRFWQIAPNKPVRYTLLELDGFTEYIEREDNKMETLQEKRTYVQLTRTYPNAMLATEILDGENYPGFPVVPLCNNKFCKSSLVGKRNTIDALDLACSNMVNNVDEGNLIYWVLTNCDGMEDLDDAKFIDRIRTMHVAHANGDVGASAEPHTIEAPYAGTNTTIDMLKRKLYEDFQCFDSSAVTSGQQTATAIKASYVPLDLKCDKFESQVTEFILEILKLAGIEDKPSYTRNKIINTQEEVNTVIAAAQYFDDEYITKKLLTLFGDTDQYEAVMQRKSEEEFGRFGDEGNNQGE